MLKNRKCTPCTQVRHDKCGNQCFSQIYGGKGIALPEIICIRGKEYTLEELFPHLDLNPQGGGPSDPTIVEIPNTKLSTFGNEGVQDHSETVNQGGATATVSVIDSTHPLTGSSDKGGTFLLGLDFLLGTQNQDTEAIFCIDFSQSVCNLTIPILDIDGYGGGQSGVDNYTDSICITALDANSNPVNVELITGGSSNNNPSVTGTGTGQACATAQDFTPGAGADANTAIATISDEIVKLTITYTDVEAATQGSSGVYIGLPCWTDKISE